MNSTKKIMEKRREKIQSTFSSKSNQIAWIEKLLQTPITGYRKNAVSLILAPYLINIRNCLINNLLELSENDLSNLII